MPQPIIANNPAVNFQENELLGVAYDKRIGQWYSVHATRTDDGWTCERREMRRIPYNEPADNAIIAGLLDAAGVARLDADGRPLLLWERVYQLAELAQPVMAVSA